MKAPETGHSTTSLLVLTALIAAVLLLSLAWFGCGNTATVNSDTTIASTSPATEGAKHQVVQFATDDGLTLSGRTYEASLSESPTTPSRKRWVILCHMYPADQSSWDAQAQRLTQIGCSVLTFDFRGYGQSQGSKDIQYLDRDVFAAVQYVRSVGAADVVLVGASMGGTACLKAASQLQTLSSIRLCAVAAFSAPVEFEGLSAQQTVAEIQLPMMFVAAEGDVGAEGARALQDLSGGRGELHILPGADHGTDMFTGAQSAEAVALLLAFVEQSLAIPGVK
jgi:pimeloyl-ACP methyl ester carboxylesterase